MNKKGFALGGWCDGPLSIILPVSGIILCLVVGVYVLIDVSEITYYPLCCPSCMISYPDVYYDKDDGLCHLTLCEHGINCTYNPNYEHKPSGVIQ